MYQKFAARTSQGKNTLELCISYEIKLLYAASAEDKRNSHFYCMRHIIIVIRQFVAMLFSSFSSLYVISFVSKWLYRNAKVSFSIHIVTALLILAVAMMHSIVYGNYIHLTETFNYSHSLSCNLYLKSWRDFFLRGQLVIEEKDELRFKNITRKTEKNVLNESIQLSVPILPVTVTHFSPLYFLNSNFMSPNE